MKETYKKLCEIMMWERYEGESYEDTFLRQEIKPQQIPNKKLIDVVHTNSLENWAKLQSFDTLNRLQNEIIQILKTAVVNPILQNKTLQELFPPIYNFCIYANNTDRKGKIISEAEKIAEVAWWGDLAQLRLKEKTNKIFNVTPDMEKYKKVSQKIKDIWGFNDIEIDAFRYFICQSRHEGHNPSMNKSLYLWSGKKRTGKTTLARAIASILNGEKTVIAGAKFESTFNKELQINDHDLPMAAQYNVCILDEAMPKDSRKSYGRVKSMLTSNTCFYNQKFGKIMPIDVKRYYIYTSNDDISDFIQDTSERRFIQINMEKMPNQISFEDIYSIWLEFAQNCTPEIDWQEWYNTFEDVDGMERKDISFFKDELLSNKSILSIVNNRFEYTLTLKFFSDILVTGKPTRDEKKALQKAITELVGEPNGYRWSRRVVYERLASGIQEQEDADIKNNIINGDDLPSDLPDDVENENLTLF